MALEGWLGVPSPRVSSRGVAVGSGVGMDRFVFERARALHGRGADPELAVGLAGGFVTVERLRARVETIEDLLGRVERGEIDARSTWRDGVVERPRFPVGEWERRLEEARRALAAAEELEGHTVIA